MLTADHAMPLFFASGFIDYAIDIYAAFRLLTFSPFFFSYAATLPFRCCSLNNATLFAAVTHAAFRADFAQLLLPD